MAERRGSDEGVGKQMRKAPDGPHRAEQGDHAGGKRPGKNVERPQQSCACGEHRYICAAHDEFAVREVDHPHHAEDDRKAQPAQHQERERVRELEEERVGLD